MNPFFLLAILPLLSIPPAVWWAMGLGALLGLVVVLAVLYWQEKRKKAASPHVQYKRIQLADPPELYRKAAGSAVEAERAKSDEKRQERDEGKTEDIFIAPLHIALRKEKEKQKERTAQQERASAAQQEAAQLQRQAEEKRQREEFERLARLKAEQERQERAAQQEAALRQRQAEEKRQREESERLARLKAEQERQARERAVQEETARRQAEEKRQREEAERQARLKAEQERQARERAAQEETARRQAEEKRQREESERLARLKAEQERQEREATAVAERSRSEAGQRQTEEKRRLEKVKQPEIIAVKYADSPADYGFAEAELYSSEGGNFKLTLYSNETATFEVLNNPGIQMLIDRQPAFFASVCEIKTSNLSQQQPGTLRKNGSRWECVQKNIIGQGRKGDSLRLTDPKLLLEERQARLEQATKERNDKATQERLARSKVKAEQEQKEKEALEQAKQAAKGRQTPDLWEETTALQQAKNEATEPVLEIWYGIPEPGKSRFWIHDLSHYPSEEAYFQLIIKQSYAIVGLSNTHTLSARLRTLAGASIRTEYLLPVCHEQPGRQGTELVMVTQGRCQLEGDFWVVTEKMQITYH